MSVKTTHDELIAEAVDHLKQAAKKLHEATAPDCWGADDISEELLGQYIDLSKAIRLAVISVGGGK